MMVAFEWNLLCQLDGKIHGFLIWVYNCRMFSLTRYSFLYSIAMRFIKVNSGVPTLLCTVMFFVEIVLCLGTLISKC